MKKMIGVLLSVTILLLLGSLLGIQYMNEEMGLSEPRPLFETENESSHSSPIIEVNELQQKQLESDEIGKGNFFSELGNGLSTALTHLSRSFLEQIIYFVDHVLNGSNTEN